MDSSQTSCGNGNLVSNLDQVIHSTQKTLGILHQLSLTVDVLSELPGCMNDLVVELDNMTKAAEHCNIEVPADVIKLIDEGKNPDDYTRDVLNGCVIKNQITKGKTETYKALRKHMLEELELAFPDEVEVYRETRLASKRIRLT